MREAEGFRDLREQFAALGAEVIGASRDSVNAQSKFAAKYNLTMALLADTGGRVRAMLGNPDDTEPASRVTYVIDAQGRVAAILGVPRIGADEHAPQALAVVERLVAG